MTRPSFGAASGSPTCRRNTGYFSGPTDYGSANFSGGVVAARRTARTRAGVPVIRFSDPAPISPAIGGRRDQPWCVRHRRGTFRPPPQERPGATMERLRRARARQPLDGVDRLQRVVQPEPAQPLVPDPEPADHRRGDPVAVARSVHRQQRHAEPSHAARARIRSSRRPAHSCRSRARWATGPSPGRTRSSRIRCWSDLALNQLAARKPTTTRCSLRVNRRFSDGFMLDANYTWSRNTGQRRLGRGQPGLQRGRHRRRSATTSTTSSTTCTSASATCRTGWSGRSCTSCRSAKGRSSAPRTRW